MKKNTHSIHKDEGWNPDVQGGEEALTKEERSLDIGESGQFAPGGYYNQQTLNQPERKRIVTTLCHPVVVDEVARKSGGPDGTKTRRKEDCNTGRRRF